MSDYKRLTDEDWLTTISVNDTNDAKLIEYAFRLWQLETKIENGTLIELPCKVGDVLYYVNKYAPTPRIEENRVHTLEIYECRDGLTIRIWTQNGTFYADKMPNVFKTKAEAEAKLEELKRG